MPARMRGVALVIVLFILAMMTILIAWLSDEVILSIRRAENLRDSTQAYQLAVGSELWGKSILARDQTESSTDHLGEGWNNLGAGVKVEQGDLTTTILDQQARFNINNLFAEISTAAVKPGQQPPAQAWTPAFKRLLIVLELDEGLTDAVLDWMDPDENVRGSNGAEDSDYLNEEPPYRAANRMFSDVSELLWVKGFDEDAVAKLAPYVCVLPETEVGININTAPLLLLRILQERILSESEASTLIEDRQKESGITLEEFLQNDMIAGEKDSVSLLADDKSEYFLIQSTAKFGKARLQLESLVQRNDDRTTVISRRRVF